MTKHLHSALWGFISSSGPDLIRTYGRVFQMYLLCIPDLLRTSLCIWYVLWMTLSYPERLVPCLFHSALRRAVLLLFPCITGILNFPSLSRCFSGNSYISSYTPLFPKQWRNRLPGNGGDRSDSSSVRSIVKNNLSYLRRFWVNGYFIVLDLFLLVVFHQIMISLQLGGPRAFPSLCIRSLHWVAFPSDVSVSRFPVPPPGSLCYSMGGCSHPNI